MALGLSQQTEKKGLAWRPWCISGVWKPLCSSVMSTETPRKVLPTEGNWGSNTKGLRAPPLHREPPEVGRQGGLTAVCLKTCLKAREKLQTALRLTRFCASLKAAQRRACSRGCWELSSCWVATPALQRRSVEWKPLASVPISLKPYFRVTTSITRVSILNLTRSHYILWAFYCDFW